MACGVYNIRTSVSYYGCDRSDHMEVFDRSCLSGRGRPKETRRRANEKELKDCGLMLSLVEALSAGVQEEGEISRACRLNTN